MNCTDIIETETIVEPMTSMVRFSAGLLGFERIKDYLLVANPDEHPFVWLKAANDTGLKFVVVDPFIVAPDYRPDIPEADVGFLDLKNADDAILLAIVTIHSKGRVTMNLKGPVVINRHTRTAKQVIISNASNYSVQHPLPVTNPAG